MTIIEYLITPYISRLFVRFQLDIGADVVVDEIEFVKGSNLLEYCGIQAPKMRMISIEQQLAEKLHAYTFPREDKFNSRAKDLVDMLLLIQLRPINAAHFRNILEKVYNTRDTHTLPKTLDPPPPEWLPLYNALATECDLSQTMSQAHGELLGFFQTLVTV